MSDKQAVIDDPNTEATPSAEGQDAQDDLDSLLNEFDQTQAKPQKAEPKREPDDDIAFLRQEAEERRKERAAQEMEQSIGSAVKSMQQTVSKSIPERVMRNYLIGEVENDPRALGLWAARQNNPNEWNRYVEGVAKRLDKDMTETPDKKLTDDRDVVTSAVHSASKHQPQEKDVDWAGLSDQEFQNMKMALARQARRK